MKGKILITGGAGFIGYHLAKYYVEKGHKVLLFDNLSRGRTDNDFAKFYLSELVEFEELDLSKSFKLTEKFDVIYHLAARNGTKHFYQTPYEVSRTNMLTLFNMLDAVKEVGCGKFIWTSSSEVYACNSYKSIPTNEKVDLVIDDIHNPRFSYASSKIAGESAVLGFIQQFDLNGCIVRPHNIYGPRMGNDHVIPEFIKKVQNKENPFVIKGGEQTRSFCYIDDFVQGLDIIAKKGKKGEIYHLGNDKEEIIIKELADMVTLIMKYEKPYKLVPDSEGSVVRRCPNINKMRKLGYEPKVTLKEGLIKTIEWYNKK